jgi:G3E family GTPase
MATEIYIISGFLGAGKTTLIQKLLKEAFKNNKVVLITNDFGEIGVDAALLKSGGVEVQDLNSGCICCSLSGDFVKALKELLSRFHPESIIIEPSGVGKLSDIMKACSDPRIQPLVEVKTKITVVDATRCKMYLDNFGEFFADQIQNADVILLSHTHDFPDKVNGAHRVVTSLNARSVVFSGPWDQITSTEIIYPEQEHHAQSECLNHTHVFNCGHRDHEHDHGHDHAAEDIFDTVTIRTNQIFSIEDLRNRISNMERSAQGTILRAKGIVRSLNGYINLQYLPGDIRITSCAASGDMLCIIGRNLNRQELVYFFEEK